MKSKILLFIVLGAILVLLIGSSIYVDFIAESSNGVTYILIAQMFLGILGLLLTLFMGLKIFENKKSHELLFIGFLETVFVLSVVIFNYVYGYGTVINQSDYIDYMGYISMEFNIYLYIVFAGIIGLLTLNLFVKYKLSISDNKVLVDDFKKAE